VDVWNIYEYCKVMRRAECHRNTLKTRKLRIFFTYVDISYFLYTHEEIVPEVVPYIFKHPVYLDIGQRIVVSFTSRLPRKVSPESFR
jgi:hypothetical protein